MNKIEYPNVFGFYKAKLYQVELFSGKFLSFIPRAIPNYPSHGVDHSKSIIHLLDDFIKNWSISLTEYEAYILYLGAWLHDIGCILEREKHNEISAEIIDKIPFFESLLEKETTVLLKNVIVAHSSSYPIDSVSQNYLGVKLQLISSIFRIMDACEICYSKCPKEVYEIIRDDLDSEADEYWKAHMNIIGVTFKSPKIILLVDDLNESEIIVQHLKEEIYSVKSVFEENNIPLPYVEVFSN